MTPVIETERLRLREHTLADFDASAALWAEPVVVRYITGTPSTREESWGHFQRYPGHWALMGYGFWLIEEKQSGAFVGEGGFGAFKRDLGVDAYDAPEQGWVLSPRMHGKGYATEACTAVVEWDERHFGRRDFVCMISPANAPSLRVAEKLGYGEYKRTTYKGEDVILLRRDESVVSSQ